MKYDLDILNDYIERGLVIKQVHPTLPLSIYNYSRSCQYGGQWDGITLNCRGLVLDNEGNVIAKPFPKFFNYEEHTADEIPNEYFDVYEKMDGSLGICFYYERELTYSERYKLWFNGNYETGMEYCEEIVPNFDDPYFHPTPTTKGEWHIATRGSFVSEQAIKGKEMLDKLNTQFGMIPGYTYLFEIIYPENRIVIDYGAREELVLLAIIDMETGIESALTDIGFPIAPSYDGLNDFDAIRKMQIDEKEGFIVKFKSGYRVKIKFTEYIRLHKIITQVSSKIIWQHLMNGLPFDDLLEKVPDEFYHWVQDTIKELKQNFTKIEEEAKAEFKDLGNRKSTALYFQTCKYPAILFRILEGKSYDQLIWKIIQPEYERPFKYSIEE
jgi:RNA ligase